MNIIENIRKLFGSDPVLREASEEQSKERVHERAKQKVLKEISSLSCLLDIPEGQNRTEEQQLMTKAVNLGICPDCGEWEMYDGPSGGMSTNIACGKCGGEFNHSGFTCERIRLVDVSAFNNATKLTPVIIRNWSRFDFFHDRNKRSEIETAMEWCSENCKSNWSANRFYIYIKEEEDAVAFKLRWT